MRLVMTHCCVIDSRLDPVQHQPGREEHKHDGKNTTGSASIIFACIGSGGGGTFLLREHQDAHDQGSAKNGSLMERRHRSTGSTGLSQFDTFNNAQYRAMKSGSEPALAGSRRAG